MRGGLALGSSECGVEGGVKSGSRRVQCASKVVLLTVAMVRNRFPGSHDQLLSI